MYFGFTGGFVYRRRTVSVSGLTENALPWM
jgi:hypothetical protein